MKPAALPQRIVCLTEVPTEVLYALREERRIVGISGFTVRPPRARHEKPRVSHSPAPGWSRSWRCCRPGDRLFRHAGRYRAGPRGVRHRGVDRQPPLDRGHFGLRAAARGHGWRTGPRAEYAAELAAHVAKVQVAADLLPRRPKVYFEEWDEPQISAIRWVSELFGIAGGEDIFPERAAASLGRDRIVADPAEVIERRPDIIIGSWCGKKFRPENVAARPGWHEPPAVRDGELHEIKSPIILQPGPTALTDGLDALHAIIAR